MTDQSSLFVPDNPQQDTGLDLLGRLTAGSFLEGDALAPLRAILHNMLAVYSTAVLVIASFVALYLVLLTIVDAAQTGKLFRKVNPVWGPLRLIMVIGLLVPLGGLNSGQYIVTALAQWGSGLASKTWALATTDIEAIKPLLATPQPPPALALVRALVLRDVCVQYTSRLAAELAAAAERQRKEAEQSGGPSQPPSAPALQTVQAQEVRQNADGSSTIPWGWAERPYYCGAVTHYPADEERDPPAMRILKEGHEEALALLEDRTENYARDYLALLAGEETGAGQQPRRMAEKYEEVLALATGQSFAAAIEAEAETARQKAAAGGWLAAPAYLDTILQLNVRTFSTMASLPQVDPPEILLNPPSYSSGSNNPAAAEYRLYQVLRRINDSWGEAPLVPPLSAAGLGGLSATLSHATALARSVSGPGSTGHKLRSARDLIRTNDFDWDKFGKASPIVGLASLGTYLTGKSVELLAGAGVLNDVGPVTGPSVTLLTTLGLLAFGASSALLLVLPLIPLVRFMFGAALWLLQVLEALVAVPLVALAHLRPEEDGIAGQSAILCYLMVLQAALRPVLMVFGLLGGFLSFLLVLAVLNRLLAALVPLVLDSGQVSSLWFVLVTGFYALLALGLANACFKLVDWLPERVLEWLSGLVRPVAVSASP